MIPSQNIYPLPDVIADEEDYTKYMDLFVAELQDRDEEIANAINGNFLGSSLANEKEWIPLLKGTATAGTFTYTHQVGWSFRQGLLVDVWFDILWSAQVGAAGNLYVELPYKVAITDQKPFVGILQTATIAYGAGQTTLTINAISDTFRGEIWSSGSGNPTANIAVAAAGQLIGHIRYIGQTDE